MKLWYHYIEPTIYAISLISPHTFILLPMVFHYSLSFAYMLVLVAFSPFGRKNQFQFILTLSTFFLAMHLDVAVENHTGML